MAEGIGRAMVAAYNVNVTGITRTRAELAKLDGAIKSLRAARYSPGTSVTVVGSTRSKDIFTSKMDELEGRVQGGVRDAMSESMALGRRVQTETLRAAETEYGAARFAAGRGHGPGRDDTGSMIAAIATNVESFQTTGDTLVTGWHGWGTEGRKHFFFQEKGTRGSNGVSKSARTKAKRSGGGRGVPPANSLGTAIPVVREHLKKKLGGLKR